MKVETDVEVTETVCHEDKIAHLQMIQGVIDRSKCMDTIDCIFSSRMFSSNGYILPQIRKAV